MFPVTPTSAHGCYIALWLAAANKCSSNPLRFSFSLISQWPSADKGFPAVSGEDLLVITWIIYRVPTLKGVFSLFSFLMELFLELIIFITVLYICYFQGAYSMEWQVILRFCIVSQLSPWFYFWKIFKNFVFGFVYTIFSFA